MEGHVEALEGVPYSVVLEARPLVFALEREGYYLDEGFEADPGSAVAKVREWAVRVGEQCPHAGPA